MTVKLTGAELNAFMADKSFWWDGRWYQDAVISVNEGDWFDWDGEKIEAQDQVRWQGGDVYDNEDVGSTFYSLEAELKKWLKKQTTTVIVLQVDKDKLTDALAAIGAINGVRIV